MELLQIQKQNRNLYMKAAYPAAPSHIPDVCPVQYGKRVGQCNARLQEQYRYRAPACLTSSNEISYKTTDSCFPEDLEKGNQLAGRCSKQSSA